MSQENIEIVLDAIRDSTRARRFLSFGYGIRMRSSMPPPQTPTPRSIAGSTRRQQFARWHDAYPDLMVEPQRQKEKGDKVFLWVRFIGRGAGTGIPMEMELAHVYSLREGKATRLLEYQDRGDGLEAAGLSE